LSDQTEKKVKKSFGSQVYNSHKELLRRAYDLLAAIRDDGYAGDCTPELDAMLRGDGEGESLLWQAIQRDSAEDGPEVEILRRPVQKLNSPRTAIARIEEEDAG
jgi:hypothetical protein